MSASSRGVNASFTVELRGTSFINPVTDIPLAGAELVAGFRVFAESLFVAPTTAAAMVAAAWLLGAVAALSVLGA